MTDQRIEAGTNDVYLVGTVEREPVYVYSERGYRIFEGMLSVPRRSGEIDHVPFVGDEQTLADMNFGEYVSVAGVLRRRDRAAYPNCVHRLVVYASSVSKAAPNWSVQNTVNLTGHLCREPGFRTTPRGRDVCELNIAIPRGGGRQDYVVCIAWHDWAHVARNFNVGDTLQCTGRFQSRDYLKRFPDGSTEQRMACEISLDAVTRITAR